MDVTTLVLQIVFGAIGAIAAAAMFRDKSLGWTASGLTGMAGGLLGGRAFALTFGYSHSGITSAVQNIASGGSGGAAAMIAAGFAWYAFKQRRK